jgi:MinD-like ATPase involved in chromosome partitioning or flagellar assembly
VSGEAGALRGPEAPRRSDGGYCSTCNLSRLTGSFCGGCGGPLTPSVTAAPAPRRFQGAAVVGAYEERAVPAAPVLSQYTKVPETAASLFDDLAGRTDTDPAAEPAPAAPRKFWRGLGRRGHQADATDEAVRYIREAGFPRAVSCVVANMKGGSGKTPAAQLLGAAIAQARSGVVVWEATDVRGSLARRSEGTPLRGIGQLASAFGEVQSVGELSSYAVTQSSGTDVIASSTGRSPLTAPEVAGVRGLLGSYYRVLIADTGTNAQSATFREVLTSGDCLIVPTLATTDSLLGALDTLDAIGTSGPRGRALANNAVIVVTHDGRAEDADTLAGFRESFPRVAPASRIAEVPFDAHIASGGPLVWAELSASSRAAWTHVASLTVTALRATTTTTPTR